MNNISDNSLTEKKKRGRKKKILSEEEIQNALNEQIVKKKRGRKKKWETETTTKILNHSPIIFNENIIEETNSVKIESNENYEQEQVLFGNLNIKLHTVKDNINFDSIKQSLQKKNNCRINLTSSDLEESSEEEPNYDYSVEIKNDNIINDNIKKKIKKKESFNIFEGKSIKSMKFYTDQYSHGEEIIFSNIRCYNCHHKFNNQPFFIPTEYCSTTKKYKVTGNFCSPNCVKSYALNSKIFSNKIYLIGEMYRKLIGYDYLIKPAPPIQVLKEYGGNLTISEYRQTFDNKLTYNLLPICSKIEYQEVIINHI